MNSLRFYIANMGVGGSLAWMGDFLCQHLEVKKDNNPHDDVVFDWQRNFAFTAFGTFYMGGIANIVYTRAIPWIASRKTVKKVFSLNNGGNTRKEFLRRGFAGSLIDNTLHAPFLYLPSYFIFTDLMRGRDNRFIAEHLERSYAVSLLSLWGIWIPVQTITFSVMPMHLRAAFVNSICLIWNIWLDFYTNVQDGDVFVVVDKNNNVTAAPPPPFLLEKKKKEEEVHNNFAQN